MFVESIKIFNQKVYNIELHQKRIDYTTKYFNLNKIVIPDLISFCPSNLKNELLKCRLIYYNDIVNIEFQIYEKPNIKSIAIIEDDNILYTYKYVNRDELKALYQRKGICDDILIVKNGEICDTFFANVVFQRGNSFVTPKSFLLNGTKRQLLINEGIVKEELVRLEDLSKFDKIYLVNSMIDIFDDISVDISKIYRI